MHRLLSFFKPCRDPRPPLDAELVGPRVTLRAGVPDDWRSWRSLRDMSRDFLVPWEPEWPPNALTNAFFCGMLRRHYREWRAGKAYAFLIFSRRDDQLIGGIGLNDIQRNIAQKGTLGYWVGYPFAGQGFMTEAAGLVCAFAFDTLRLHRIEASCLPSNQPSMRLLSRLGFLQEGYAKDYLRINGKWQDHVLWRKAK